MHRFNRSSASSTAASRGIIPRVAASPSTSRVLSRTFSSMAWNAADGEAPRYSMAALITPPALAIISGTHSTPFSCSQCSAPCVMGMLAPSSTSLVFKRLTFVSLITSGRAAGIQISHSSSITASRSSFSPAVDSVTLLPASFNAIRASTSSPRGL